MQKQKLLNSAKFAIDRLIYQQAGPEYQQNVQAAQEQLVEATGELPKAAAGTDAEFKAAQKKFNKAEQELAKAEKLLKSGAGAEKKERSTEECTQITRKFLAKNNLSEAGLKKYLGLAENAGAADFVKKLQEKQTALGFKGDDADGIFGKKTFDAVTTADKKNALAMLEGGAEKPLFTEAEKQKAEQALTATANKLLEAYAQLPEVTSYDSSESLQFLTDFYKKYTETFAELNHYDQLIQNFDQFPAKIAITLPGNRTVFLGIGNLARDFKNNILGTEKNQKINAALAIAGKSDVSKQNLATAGKKGREIADAMTGGKENRAEHNLAVYKNQVEEWAKKLALAGETDRTNVALELHKQTKSYQSIFDAAGKTPDQFLTDVAKRQKSLIAEASSGSRSA